MDALKIGTREFHSRLILGTGKYRSFEEMRACLEASSAEIVTVALRRLDLSNPHQPSLLDYIDTSRYVILPNTAGCKTVQSVQTARLAAAMGLPRWVKLEIIPDPTYLLPGLPSSAVMVREKSSSRRASMSFLISTPTPYWPCNCRMRAQQQ